MRTIYSVSPGYSEQRLEALINERLKDGADKEKIDKRIWDLFGEKWCVMFTDLSGFSRNVSKFGIIHFLQVILESQKVLIPIIEEHDGILLKTEGDSLLVIFRNVKKAVECSRYMQKTLKTYNLSKEEEEKIYLCLGLGYGDVLRIGDADVFGEEVNSASKLGEDTAKAEEILVTEAVKKEIEDMNGIKIVEIEDKPSAIKRAYKIEEI